MVLSIPQDINLKTTGKIANKVYYEVDGEKRVRAYVIPIQPKTKAQKDWWKIFKTFVKDWQGLSDTEKAPWNRLGEIFQMSGFNKYMSEKLQDAP